LQPDGKLVFAGQTTSGTLVLRYTSNGSLDTTFNGTGRKLIWGRYPRDVLVQPDGKIVVGGNINRNFLITRLNPNGSLDTTFNGTGRRQIDFDGDHPLGFADYLSAIARQPADGKYVLVGTLSYESNFQYGDFAAARVLP
jgi:uncharacterized delta-60 repeat protein